MEFRSMDAIISSSLEEICSKGRNGVALSSLFSSSNLASSRMEIKQALWTNLLKVPAIQFRKQNRVYDNTDPSIQRFDKALKLDLIIVATNKLSDNYLGIYDFSLGGEGEEKEFHQQRVVLERIATARTNGITQSQLSKEFGIEGNRFFYVVKKLEKRGLIVRQEAIEKTRGSGKQGQTTRLIHLYRFAKHLGSQEKFEVTLNKGKEDSNVEHSKEDVLVNDYVPAMKAICDKLEEALGKVLVISDIKRDLGYIGSQQAKHRWERIYVRLKNAGLVEEINAEVNGKDERCLHLIKEFSRLDLEQNTTGCVGGKEFKFGRCEIANQLVELPIDHQIYDTIDAAGSKGMFITEIGERFGIDKKRNRRNCFTMSSKFGMPMQMELHNKSHEYKIQTARNSESSNAIPSRSKDLGVVNPRCSDGSAQISHVWNSESDTICKKNNYGNEIKLSSCSPRECEASNNISNTCKPQENRAIPSVHSATMMFKPCQSLTVDSIRREQRILERLQVEKIVLRADLYKLLVNLEKDKGTTMGRRTVDKILYKLANEGRCKCIHLDVHEIMNSKVKRKFTVVLHPSIDSLSSEVIGIIRDKIKSFDKRTHNPASFRKKDNNSVRLLDCIQRTRTQDGSNALSIRLEAMRANGYILAKMIRARLLHIFFWDYARSSSARDDDHDLQNLFDVESVIKGIPLELFLQVAGSTVVVDNMREKFKEGICLRDLSIQEYNDLKHTSAIRRLSSVLSILERLKLIRPVTRGSSDDGVVFSHASPIYALELKPYIEELPLIATYPNSESLNLFPDRDFKQEVIRHEFILSNRDAIDEYWQFLEYTYAGVDRKAASHAFPASTVHEIFCHKAWTPVLGMNVGQHAAVTRLIANSKFNEKLPYKKCKEIAKNLNLTMEQVLRVFYYKLRRKLRCRKKNQNLNAPEAEFQPMIISSFSRKRKRSAKPTASKNKKVDKEAGPCSQKNLPRSVGSDKDFIEEENLKLASGQDHESQLQEQQEEDHWKDSEMPEVQRDNYDSSTNHSAFSKLKSVRRRRFHWTDDADRKLVIQYVKHTVGLGAKLFDEGSVSFGNLPTHPNACGRRLRFLKQNRKFRESLKSLCNMLTKQPEKLLEQMKRGSMDDDNCEPPIPSSLGAAGIDTSLLEGTECNKNDSDSFSKENIIFALEEVLRSREAPVVEAPRNVNICDSQFPLHTGSGAARFSRWLHEREKDFKKGGLDITVDLRCGETFHLFGLVSSGELFISPCIPVEGVGEAEFIKGLSTSFVDDAIDNRREKGFTGIKLFVHRAAMPRDVSLESSFNGEIFCNEHFVGGNYLGTNSGTLEVGCNPSHSEIIKENPNFERTVPIPEDSCKPPWGLMVDYASHLMTSSSSQEHVGSLSAEVFTSVYTAIQEAGDQGLVIGEVSRVTNTLGEKLVELVIDILQKFGQVEKVSFDSSFRVIAQSTTKPSSIHMDDKDVQKFIFNHHEDVDGINRNKIHKKIITRALRIVMQNPGILEDDIIRKMDLPIPTSQHFKKLLRLMVRNKYLIVKKRHQSKPTGVPAFLATLIGGNSSISELIYREHFFVNPMSSFLL